MKKGFLWNGKKYTVEEMIAYAKEHPEFPFSPSILLLIAESMTERNGIHVTDLVSPCFRKSWLEKHVEYAVEPQEMMAMVMGTIVHSFLERGDGLKELDIQVSVGEATILGRIDYFDPERGILEDYKTTRWIVPSKLPYGTHVEQVNVYAWMLKQNGYNPRRAFVRYIDLSGPSRCDRCRVNLISYEYPGELLVCPSCQALYSTKTHHLGVVQVEIPLWEESFCSSWVEKRLNQLMEVLASKQEPPVERTWLCIYCPFRKRCWGAHSHDLR